MCLPILPHLYWVVHPLGCRLYPSHTIHPLAHLPPMYLLTPPTACPSHSALSQTPVRYSPRLPWYAFLETPVATINFPLSHRPLSAANVGGRQLRLCFLHFPHRWCRPCSAAPASPLFSAGNRCASLPLFSPLLLTGPNIPSRTVAPPVTLSYRTSPSMWCPPLTIAAYFPISSRPSAPAWRSALTPDSRNRFDPWDAPGI